MEMLNWNAEFLASLQSSVSHDPSDVFLICLFSVQDFLLLVLSILKTVFSA